jgi:pimeloyl-ACP methyl ester carboxylesterase
VGRFFCGIAMLAAAFVLAPTIASAAQDQAPAYGPELQGFDYPFPVSQFRFQSQGQDLEMAYMDVWPQSPNGKTAVLLPGKNFCAATWVATIEKLTASGYRVIAPDQIGFCKSSKPTSYQFSFQQLAGNTHALLTSIGITHAILIGHSTGGMLAIRYALMYPDALDQLVLVDPIGLEDWKARGVPWLSVDGWYAHELKTTADSIRNYERATYYAGTWKPAYDIWVQMLAGIYRGSGKQLVAWDSALLYDMIYTQPVVYELAHLSMPVLLMIGDKDRTAIGKDLAPPAVRATLGDYPPLGKAAAERIPHVHLIEFPNLGHSPQIWAPAQFHAALLDWLKNPATDAPAGSNCVSDPPHGAAAWGYSAADRREDILVSHCLRRTSVTIPAAVNQFISSQNIGSLARLAASLRSRCWLSLSAMLANHGMPVFHTDVPPFVATKSATKLNTYRTREWQRTRYQSRKITFASRVARSPKADSEQQEPHGANRGVSVSVSLFRPVCGRRLA